MGWNQPGRLETNQVDDFLHKKKSLSKTSTEKSFCWRDHATGTLPPQRCSKNSKSGRPRFTSNELSTGIPGTPSVLFFEALDTPKTSNYCLTNRALGFPGWLKKLCIFRKNKQHPVFWVHFFSQMGEPISGEKKLEDVHETCPVGSIMGSTRPFSTFHR